MNVLENNIANVACELPKVLQYNHDFDTLLKRRMGTVES